MRMRLLSKLSPRDRRALGILSIVSSTVLVTAVVIMPFLETAAETRRSLRDKSRYLSKSLDTLSQHPVHERQLKALESSQSRLESFLFPVSSPGEARIRLLEAVTDLGQRHDVVIRSTGEVTNRVHDDYVKVSLRLELRTNIVGLAEFLNALASHPIYIVVDQFEFSMPPIRRSARRAARDPRIRLTVSGFHKPEGSTGDSPGRAHPRT